MKTNIKTTLFSPKTLAVMGLCIAMTVVLDKFVIIPVGSAIRIGLGALPVIFASNYISPVAGAITALIADLLGCVLAGYTINPVVTLGFVLTAFLSGIFYNYVFVKLPLTLRLFLSIIPAAAVGSALVTSFGLWLWYAKGTPFYLYVIGRLPSFAINYTAITVIIRLVVLNSGARAFFGRLRGETK